MSAVCPIMLCFDDNFVLPAGVAIWSLLKHASKDKTYPIHVVHTGITPRHQACLRRTVSRFPNASIEFTEGGALLERLWEATFNKGHFAKEIYCKVLIGDIFPQYRRMLITDVDVLFLDDIAQLTDAVSGEADFAFAGVHGIPLPPESSKAQWCAAHRRPLRVGRWSSPNHEHDVGGGLLVANLDFLRTHRLAEEMAACTLEVGDRLSQPEQDVINIVCSKLNILLPQRAMVCSYVYPFDRLHPGWRDRSSVPRHTLDEALAHPIQLHYAAPDYKPWNRLFVPYGGLWLLYCIRSGWLGAYVLHVLPLIPHGAARCVRQGLRRVRRGLKAFLWRRQTVNR